MHLDAHLRADVSCLTPSTSLLVRRAFLSRIYPNDRLTVPLCIMMVMPAVAQAVSPLIAAGLLSIDALGLQGWQVEARATPARTDRGGASCFARRPRRRARVSSPSLQLRVRL